MPKFTLFDNPEKNLKAAGFKDEAHFSDVLKSDILSGIEDIIGRKFEPNPIREGDGGDSFASDLVCKISDTSDTGENSHTVIIENQFNKSDHDHLGKCITYGSNRAAKIVIWICEDFRDAHVKSLQWLNEHFKDSVGFYGLEVKAYKHPDSVKIKFESVVEPLEDILNEGEFNQRQRTRQQIFESAQEKFNKISSETDTKKIKKWKDHDCFTTKQFRLYWRHMPSQSVIASFVKCYKNKDEKKMMENYRRLEDNKENIQKILPDVEFRNAMDDDEIEGDRPHLKISIPVPKNLEDITDSDSMKVSEKLADDMKKFVDIVKELKL